MAAYMLVREGMTKGFNQADVDGDGFISEEELGTLLSSIGETMSEEEVASQFKEANVLNKDKITYEQWCKVRCAVDTSAVWLVAETRSSLHLSAHRPSSTRARRRSRARPAVAAASSSRGTSKCGKTFSSRHTHTHAIRPARKDSKRERAGGHAWT